MCACIIIQRNTSLGRGLGVRSCWRTGTSVKKKHTVSSWINTLTAAPVNYRTLMSQAQLLRRLRIAKSPQPVVRHEPPIERQAVHSSATVPTMQTLPEDALQSVKQTRITTRLWGDKESVIFPCLWWFAMFFMLLHVAPGAVVMETMPDAAETLGLYRTVVMGLIHTDRGRNSTSPRAWTFSHIPA